MKYDDLLQTIGNTPHVLVRPDGPSAARVYVKLEGANPTGSVKDRAALRMIQGARARGELRPGMTLLDASSGNMACAVAFYGRLFGHDATVVAGSKLTQDKQNFIEYYGAELRRVGDFTIEGNRFCRELVGRSEPGRYYFLDQLHNWDNPRAHFETTGPEILRDFPEVAMVVGSLGSGGTLCGTAQFLKQHRPGVEVVAVQSAPGTKIPGTGSFDDGDYVTPFISKGFDERLFSRAYKVSEREAVAGALELRDRGIFAGLQTGGVWRAALACAAESGVAGEVVVISGDSGWKNMDKLLTIAG